MTEKKIEKAKLMHVKNNLEIYNKNKDLILMYDNYIEKIVELFDFIKKSNSDLFYAIVFGTLIDIGFFSADRNFNRDEVNYHELLIKPGINIICGNGVCRNIAYFYEDVFKYFYNYPLKLCCFDELGEITSDTLVYGNHVINLCDYHDTIYGFDIYNHCIFKAKDATNLEGIGFNYSLKYMPNGDLLLELTNSIDIHSNFLKEVELKQKLLEKAATQNNLSLEQFQRLVKYANAFIIERKKLIQSFVVDNEELTHEIKKKMLSLK